MRARATNRGGRRRSASARARRRGRDPRRHARRGSPHGSRLRGGGGRDRARAGPAARRDKALDLAVLDINLNGKLSFPVAEVLRERRIPFLFASGYGSRGLIEAYKDAVRIQKPFRSRDLALAIERATGPARH